MPRVTAAVFALEVLVEAIYVIKVLSPAGLLELLHDPVTLGVDVGRDVVGELTGGVA